MKFNYKNREELNAQYIHDSYFEGYQYDYERRQISLSCIDNFREIKICLKFSNVIFAEMQSCEFWSPGSNNIYDIWTEDDSEQMHQLMGCMDSNEEKYNMNRLTEEIDYIQIKIQIISGDVFFVICEELEWLEEKWCKNSGEDNMK